MLGPSVPLSLHPGSAGVSSWLWLVTTLGHFSWTSCVLRNRLLYLGLCHPLCSCSASSVSRQGPPGSLGWALAGKDSSGQWLPKRPVYLLIQMP